MCEDNCHTWRSQDVTHGSGKYPVSKASRPGSARPTFHAGSLDRGALLCLVCPSCSGGQVAKRQRPLDLCLRPPSLLHFAVGRAPGARPEGRGESGAGPGNPEIPGAPPHLGRLPAPPPPQGRSYAGWGGRSRPAWRGVVGGEPLPLPRLCHRREAGVKVPPQVCGWGAAARGAAIFGHFGAAGAPPAAREAAARAAPSPPAAGPESPAGRGAEVTDRGRGARSSPYLVKEAADWPAEQRGGGGGGRAAAAPTPSPALAGPRDPAASWPARRENGGWGCARPPRSGGGERSWGAGGGEGRPPAREAAPATRRTRMRGCGVRPEIERGLEPCAVFCAVIFLFCSWAVRGLAQGHFRAVPGRPHPS